MLEVNLVLGWEEEVVGNQKLLATLFAYFLSWFRDLSKNNSVSDGEIPLLRCFLFI